MQAFLSILGFSGFEMDDTSKFPEQSPTISDKDSRRHPRESCFIETGYRVQNLWYRGCIQDISAGGAYVEAMESKIFLPGEDILLVARIRVLREQLRGKIAWVGRYGMGVSFQIPELDSGQVAIAANDGLTAEREAKSIGKIKNRKVFWEPSSTPGVASGSIGQ
ncbi:MAG: PilZ domain-containing protein [Desulfatiglandales bacterium]